jgi:hypothetical protein
MACSLYNCACPMMTDSRGPSKHVHISENDVYNKRLSPVDLSRLVHICMQFASHVVLKANTDWRTSYVRYMSSLGTGGRLLDALQLNSISTCAQRRCVISSDEEYRRSSNWKQFDISLIPPCRWPFCAWLKELFSLQASGVFRHCDLFQVHFITLRRCKQGHCRLLG